MGMSTHIEGIAPPDAKWKKMKQAWDACNLANVPVPEEVTRFFNFETPDEDGVLRNLKGTDCCEEYVSDMTDGFQVDLQKVPAGVRYIRFTNSY